MIVTVVEMPLLSPGITCPYCGKPIMSDRVYSVDGHKYRCQDCAKRLIDRIKELRDGQMCKGQL